MEATLDMKCRKCRFVLLSYPKTRVETSHGSLAYALLHNEENAKTCGSEVWYIPEDQMPTWMNDNIEKGEWVKGKVQCPKCEGRLGSYNFVSGMKCPCGLKVVAPIHIVKSKVDFFIPPPPMKSSEDEPEKSNVPNEESSSQNASNTSTIEQRLE